MKSNKFMNVPNKSHICMRISTWNKDSHGLYDYQSSAENYTIEKFYMDSSTVIFRDALSNQRNNEDPITRLQLKSQLKSVRESFSNVASISIDRNQNNTSFKFQSTAVAGEDHLCYDPTRTFYKVIRQSTVDSLSDGFALKPGNIVKMGRVEYMVIEMRNNFETLTIRDTNHFNETNGVFEAKKIEESMEDGNQIRCKVCLCSEQTEVDPLISPCQCKGSLLKIHVGCLRQWINSKVRKDINDVATSYNFTKFECEICKSPFPRIVKVGKQQVEMMSIHKPEKPYLILESLTRNTMQSMKEERCLHLISAKQNASIKIGRGHQCEIRLTDISVSRAHANIIFKNDQFYIKDQKSKFGTLIKFEGTHDFERDEVLKLQFGRSLFQFEIQGLSEEVDTDEQV